MSEWSKDVLEAIAAADEIRLAIRRRDGSLRRPVIVWVVRVGDDLYVRSYLGNRAAWYRAVQATHQGRVLANGVEQDVTFVEEADPKLNAQIDAAYRNKYRSHGASYVEAMVAPEVRATTLRLVPSTES